MVKLDTAPSGASDIVLAVQTKRAGKIKGESTTQGHPDEIAVTGWDWGVTAGSAIGSGAATARRAYKNLVVRKQIDSASTGLMSALVSNDEVKSAALVMRKAGGDALDYFTLRLSGARVVGIDIDVGPDGAPVERVTFAYTRIEVEYKRQQDGGGNAGSFSFSDELLPASP